MDGAHLARWTRFAAKGGIGKCTAVQDCIAESPEDLMFLKVSPRISAPYAFVLRHLPCKDDEITVLMQLHSQTGWYLVRLVSFPLEFAFSSSRLKRDIVKVSLVDSRELTFVFMTSSSVRLKRNGRLRRPCLPQARPFLLRPHRPGHSSHLYLAQLSSMTRQIISVNQPV